MKAMILLSLYVGMMAPALAGAYTLVFETGFEGPIGIESPRTGKSTYFLDCGGDTTCKNTVYCTIGCTDSKSGYNLSADIPGRWNAEGKLESNINHTVSVSDSKVIINTNRDYVQSGTQSLGLYLGDKLSGNRNQLNLYTSKSGATWNNMNKTCVMFWIYLDMDGWSSRYNVLNEWRGPDNKLIMHSGGYQYIVGGTKKSNSYAFAQNTDTVFPLKKWVQVLIYHKAATHGEFIFRYKEEGKSAVEVFNWTGKNNVEFNANDLNDRRDRDVGAYNPIKQYGSRKWWMFIDLLQMFATSGPHDLPEFDFSKPGVDPDDPQQPSKFQPKGINTIKDRLLDSIKKAIQE